MSAIEPSKSYALTREGAAAEGVAERRAGDDRPEPRPARELVPPLDQLAEDSRARGRPPEGGEPQPREEGGAPEEGDCVDGDRPARPDGRDEPAGEPGT